MLNQPQMINREKDLPWRGPYWAMVSTESKSNSLIVKSADSVGDGEGTHQLKEKKRGQNYE